MYSVHDRVIVDNMSEFEHSSSRATCTFSMQDLRLKRGSTTGQTTPQARLPADSGLHNSTFPSLVNGILTIPECRSDHHSRVHAQHRPDKASALSLSDNSPLGVSQFTKFPIACCFALALLIALALLMAVIICSS